VRSVISAGAASILAALTAACVEPPVKPIPDAARQSIAAVSADVSGSKESDTSKLGARGSDEGARLGALQGAATVLSNSGNSGLLGIILAPVGAAVGGAKGASEARAVDVVDETRGNLRVAIQETDFTELLRQRLATSQAAGRVDFSTVTTNPSTAPLTTGAGLPVGHVIAIEYRLQVYSAHLVNPEIGVYVRVTAQVQSPDRKQLVHTATWTYCGDRYDFVQMAANNAAAFKGQINQAAAVLGEAIPYDLYVSREPRRLQASQLGAVRVVVGCMDFSNLPSRTGQAPVILPPMPTATTAPPVQAPTPAVVPTPVSATGGSVRSFDGSWQIEMVRLSTTYGTTVGGECPVRHTFPPITFTNGVAEGPWGKLQISVDGAVSGWMNVPAVRTSTLPFIVNPSGAVENGAGRGTVSGRCTGSFAMSKIR
jgi:hypothetical protein